MLQQLAKKPYYSLMAKKLNYQFTAAHWAQM